MGNRTWIVYCSIYAMFWVSLIHGVEQDKEQPEMRLYKENKIKSKGSAKIPDELDSDPLQTGQAINYLFGHDPNCVRKPLDSASELFSSEWYFANVETILILHDKCGSASDIWVSGILEALNMRGIWKNYNILAMDIPNFMCEITSKLRDFIGMESDLQNASKQISEFFKNGVTKGKIRLDQINIIGLGMGAQLAGDVGRALKSGDAKIKSIVGLNPSKFGNVPHVSKDDAQIVQLLHTDSKVYGTTERVGTADFVINGANSIQPLCEKKGSDCSHTRCFQIFTAVIVFTSRFQAWRCSSWEDFVADSSKYANDYGYIFYPLDETLKGTYCLRAGNTFPYGIGEDGMRFDKNTVDRGNMPNYKPKIIPRKSKSPPTGRK